MSKILIPTLLCILTFSFSFQVHAQVIELQKRDAKTFFHALNKDTMDLVDQFYAEDVHFKDPVVEFHNREDLKHYYRSAYESTDEVTFEIPHVLNQGNEQVVVWVMSMTVKGMNRGKPILVEGTSYIQYDEDGKAVYHRDYFDMGEMIYSHVPFVRGMVRFVNRRMRSKHEPKMQK